MAATTNHSEAMFIPEGNSVREFIFWSTWTTLAYISVNLNMNVIHVLVNLQPLDQALAVVIKISVLFAFWYKSKKQLARTALWWKRKFKVFKERFSNYNRDMKDR